MESLIPVYRYAVSRIRRQDSCCAAAADDVWNGMGQAWRNERCSCSKADCPFSPFLIAGLPTVSAETFFGFTECVETEGQPDNLNIESLLWPQQDRKVGHLSGS